MLFKKTIKVFLFKIFGIREERQKSSSHKMYHNFKLLRCLWLIQIMGQNMEDSIYLKMGKPMDGTIIKIRIFREGRLSL